MEDERKTPVNQIQSQTGSDPQYREQSESADKVSTEYKFSLKMRVQYRVSEEAIRSLEILR
jgi:hypothetical protein